MSCTLEEQHALSTLVRELLQSTTSRSSSLGPEWRLQRSLHAAFLFRPLTRALPQGYTALDASKPWICFWSVHGLNLLEVPIPPRVREETLQTLRECQSNGKTGVDEGGFGGGGWQSPHLASSYAAVAALVSLGGQDALSIIDRVSMANFLRRMKVNEEEGGGFRLMRDGEVDVRGTYCALAIVYMLRLPAAEFIRGIPHYLQRCQTYEGGIAGAPGCEAHGGYTFCAIAALRLCEMMGGEEAVAGAELLDLKSLFIWATRMQGGVEGGFAGRTNKLVDGCYSFWVGGVLKLLKEKTADIVAAIGPGSVHSENLEEFRGWVDGVAGKNAKSRILPYIDVVADKVKKNDTNMVEGFDIHTALHLQSSADDIDASGGATSDALFDVAALQAWIIRCCQCDTGGLRDKPGKHPDFYHTCYCLSGLSLAQYCRSPEGDPIVLGHPENLLGETDVLINVRKDKLRECLLFFEVSSV